MPLLDALHGAGWQLAEWIVDGEPTVDLMGVDPRRFGPYAGRGYLKEKKVAAYNWGFVAGKSNKEIAREVNRSVGTVKNHVHSILDKLQLHGRADAASWFSRIHGVP